MNKKYTDAYVSGVTAGKNGQQVGTNPHDPESDPESYEAWVDGWIRGSQNND